ncbi:porphobilinogen synthase [Candidatus Sumerlaeota bacterium]|nr:porphobilinogen synthase [Candidatus Sumerlaeota bacterium]
MAKLSPFRRHRRLRMKEPVRRMIRETIIAPDDFILPLFVVPGSGVRREVGSMPGVFNLSVDELAREAEQAVALGIPAVLLFGIPESKDEVGSGAYDPDGIVQRAIHALKRDFADLVVIADCCLCEYTSHGHCGIVRDGKIVNDESVELLARAAVAQARAGADMIAPSDMFDGRVAIIRAALDEHGFGDIAILAYAAKYASCFYGPFRDAAQSAPAFGDRRSHQMDPPNVREALREIESDFAEGADIVMVKPALAYLDVIRAARERFDVPLAAYNVSGEYSMVKAAAARGWLDGDRAMMEILTAIKRAGADLIVSYHALEAARLLRGSK